MIYSVETKEQFFGSLQELLGQRYIDYERKLPSKMKNDREMNLNVKKSQTMSDHDGKNYFVNYLFKVFVLWPSYDGQLKRVIKINRSNLLWGLSKEIFRMLLESGYQWVQSMIMDIF